MVEFRTGIGHDIHRLVPGKDIVLGGVVVSTDVGFDTHLDGDVLCHALIDALAGAMADGDLGTHFPEGDLEAENARSLDFVREFAQHVKNAGFLDQERGLIRSAGTDHAAPAHRFDADQLG